MFRSPIAVSTAAITSRCGGLRSRRPTTISRSSVSSSLSRFLSSSATPSPPVTAANAVPKGTKPLLHHPDLAAYKFKTPNANNNNKKDNKHLLWTAGVPFVLFSVLAAWVVSNALDGKLKEMEVSQGKQSLSNRQAKLKEEKDDMMDRLGKIVEQDFDNTVRIKRPEEVLKERRAEREKRNKWYRRAWRAVSGGV